jgi:hypothetical protein
MKFYLCTNCSDMPTPYCYLAIDEGLTKTLSRCPFNIPIVTWEEIDWGTFQTLVSNQQGGGTRG